MVQISSQPKVSGAIMELGAPSWLRCSGMYSGMVQASSWLGGNPQVLQARAKPHQGRTKQGTYPGPVLAEIQTGLWGII